LYSMYWCKCYMRFYRKNYKMQRWLLCSSYNRYLYIMWYKLSNMFISNYS